MTHSVQLPAENDAAHAPLWPPDGAPYGTGPFGEPTSIHATLAGPEDRLVQGLWPASLAIWMAALYIGLHIIRPWERLFPWLGPLHAERAFAIAMILVAGLTRGFRLRARWQTFGVLALALAVVLSALRAWKPEFSWTGNDSVYVLGAMCVFYFILISVIRTPYELFFLLACYVVATALYVGKSQWEYWLHGAGRDSMGVIRLQGIDLTYGHPNTVAESIVVSIPLALLLLRHRRFIAATWPALWKRLFHLGLLAYAALIVPSVVLTQSRAGMLGCLLAGGLIIRRTASLERKALAMLAALIVVAVTWLAASPETRGRFLSIWDPAASTQSAYQSAQGRVEGVKMGWEMFRRFPLTGVGVGNYLPYRMTHLDKVALEAHNLYAQVLSTTGIIGAVAFAMAVLPIWLGSRKIRRDGRWLGDERGALWVGFADAVMDSLLLLLFFGLFQHNMFRMNWLWLAGFTLAARELIRHQIAWLALDFDPEYGPDGAAPQSLPGAGRP